MKLEINLPEFKAPEFKGFTNPLTKEGMGALAFVLGVIVVISGIVCAANFGKGRGASVLPAQTGLPAQAGEEFAATPSAVPTPPTGGPTITPLAKEEELLASPSPTRKAPTGVIVTPAATP